MKTITIPSLLCLALAMAADAADAPHPGKAVYDQACAACHDKPTETRSVPFETLRGMRYGAIRFALTEGKMKPQAAGLSESQVSLLTDYLVGRQVIDDSWIGAMQCPADRRIDFTAPATVTGFGFERQNHRALSKEQAGLATADFSAMEVAWAIGFPQATTMRSQPAVVGKTLFLPVGDNARVFAIDISTDRPCLHWVYTSDVPLRSGAGYGEIPGSKRKVLVFNDAAARIHLIDAATGKLIWKKHVGIMPLSNTTGTPVIYGDRVYVPLSASEINVGGDDSYECCKTHGAFTALDVKTGRTVWFTHTMVDAKPVRDRGDGKMMWGPSGAPIWTSPALDLKRGLIYVGTGEATSAPAADTTDSILALDMKTGKIRWKFQATADDIFLTTCMARPKNLNCPREGRLLDHDFGASVVIAQRPDGRDIILAGQKSGTLWALDPDNRGKLLWSREFGKGSPIGGIHWGLAFDGTRVFTPIHNFPGPDGLDPNQTPGLHAVDVETGKVLWSFEAKSDCSGDRAVRLKGCKGNIGMSAAPTVIDGVIVQGSVDSLLRVFNRETGELLFTFDTARSFPTVNGVPGTGGAIDNASIVAANGYLFFNAGYGLFGGQNPGNVFMALRPKAK